MNDQSARRQVLILASAQALFQTASVAVVTVGALAGSQIAAAAQLATAPVASMMLGTALATVPAPAGSPASCSGHCSVYSVG